MLFQGEFRGSFLMESQLRAVLVMDSLWGIWNDEVENEVGTYGHSR